MTRRTGFIYFCGLTCDFGAARLSHDVTNLAHQFYADKSPADDPVCSINLRLHVDVESGLHRAVITG